MPCSLRYAPSALFWTSVVRSETTPLRTPQLKTLEQGSWLPVQDFLGRPFIVSGSFGLQPHRQEVFTLSKDPYLIDKVREVVGLYRNHPTMLWCSVWTKRAKSRPSSAASPSCQCDRVAPSVGAMTTIGTAPLRSLPLWMWQPVGSLEPPNRVIEARNF